MIKKITWGLIVVLAIFVGLFPFVFYANGIEFGIVSNKESGLVVNLLWKIAFHTHIIFAAIALLIGWLQFYAKVRTQYPCIHKSVGKLYIIVSLPGAFAGFYIALFSTGGFIATVGFICLASVWLYTTLMGYRMIRTQKINEHRQMMIYSYAACFAGVTLRIELLVLELIFGNHEIAYSVVAWLCWIPNLMIAYQINQKNRNAKSLLRL